MSINFDQIVTAVQIRVADHSLATDTVVGKLVNESHQEEIESAEYSRKKTEIIVNTIAEESTGTFSVTNGSETITGTSTSLSSDDVGKYIKFSSDNNFYFVKAVSDPDITLGDFNGTTVTYSGDTNTAVAYVIWTRFYNLGTAIESIYAAQYKLEITEMLLSDLDKIDPQRSSTGDPLHYILGPRDSSDLVQIELFPRPTGTIALTFGVIKGHTTLSGSDLPIVPGAILLWSAAILACHYIFAKTRDKRFLELVDRFEQKRAMAKEFVKAQDEGKFGLPHHIRAADDHAGLAHSDFGLDRDLGFRHGH